MNTLEILDKIRNDSVLGHVFVGVFPINLLPKVKHFPAALIINLDSSNLPGSHWVALYFTKRKCCDYFDSYGRKPNISILSYITENTKSYTYNNICVQNLWSTNCGQLCLYFLIWRCRQIKFRQIILSMRNDDTIAGFVDSL
jgi:hypothetical protein